MKMQDIFRPSVLILLLALLILSSALGAETGPEIDYEAQLTELLKLDEQGIQNPDLYNNIGICYHYLGSRGKAALYFLRAQNLDSSHVEARENLEYIIDLSVDKAMYPDHVYLVQLFFRVYNYLNINRLALVVLLLFALFVLSVHWLLNYDPLREKGLPVLMILISLVLLFTFSAMLATKYRRMMHNQKAVVIAEETDGYDGSGMQYNRLFTIREALILQIEKSSDGWSLVSLPNGISGWVQDKDIARVRR